MGKPITEVMAQLHYEAKRRRTGDITAHMNPWEELDPKLKAKFMLDMSEVTKFFGLFNLELRIEEDRGFLAKIEKPDRSNVVRLPPPQAPPLENTPQFTGRACPECSSLNTVQNGKCLLCMECKATGECG